MKNLFVLILVLPYFVLSQTRTVEWHTNEKENYSFQYPPDWTIEAPGQVGEEVCTFGPKYNDEENKEYV